MPSIGPLVKRCLRSPLLPFWLVIALLPFGRSAELGTLLCLIGVVMLFLREPRALTQHAGAQLLLWLLAAYVGAAVLSSFDALLPGKSWGTSIGLLRYVPLGLYACFAIRRVERLHQLYLAVAAVLLLWVVDAWVQILTGWSLGGPAAAARISGIFGADNLKLGPTLAVLSPFALWSARRRWGLAGLLLAFVLVLVPVLLAGSRAAWLCYGLVVLGCSWREAGSLRRFAGLASGAVLVLVLVGAVAWRTSPRFDQRLQLTTLALQGNARSLNTALSGRLDIWHVSRRMFAAHPINGVGVRDFRYAYPHYAAADDHFLLAEPCGPGQGACHPHQLLLEILTGTGVVGLLLWLAAAALALRAWRRVGRAARERAFPTSLALGVMLFPLNTHFAFYSAWWGLLFAWLLGLWCAALFVAGVLAGEAGPGIHAGLSKEARFMEGSDRDGCDGP